MHMFAVVLVPAGTEEIDKAVAELMRPHEERYGPGEDDYAGWWDWYRIGGRFDGAIKGAYRAESCPACSAGGQAGTDCHYRSGTHDQLQHNIVPVAQLGEVRPFTVVAPDVVAHRSWWDATVPSDIDGCHGDFVEDPDWDRTCATILLTHRDHVAVGVDYHS